MLRWPPRQKSQLSLWTVAVLLPLLTSCANKLILHPVDGQDIQEVKNGDVVKIRHGYIFSDLYLDQVMQVIVEKHR